jgi:Fuc2NAc and GlcNAc transferase
VVLVSFSAFVIPLAPYDSIAAGVAAAFLLGATGALLVDRYGRRVGLLDEPCERSSHRRTTPKGGGIGILAAFLGAAAFLGLPVWFWLPVTVVSVMSLIGDRMHLPQIPRLGVQFLCATALVVGCYLLGPAKVSGRWWIWVAMGVPSVIYIVGTANCFNFMDGINGIAGLIGALAFWALGIHHGSAGPVALLSLSMAAACLGFLPLNFPSARVFMGDVGSVLLGFLFAASVVLVSHSVLDWVCLSSLLFPFYADELTTMAVRIRDRENLLRAHRRHIYQVLANQRGVPHWKVSLLYVAVQLVVSGLALSFRSLGVVAVWLGVAFVGFICAGAYVRRWERTPIGISG